ncbi:hypothetical protein [Engelhardtia mirabilis]|uniref:Uncharacterized protein n=1 Tax=Engelhardtia mirabilis TaxID=2528011 RepID=A0A518BQM1_9BACT|nr:hypothetical protein Pla133_43900 [Planctomycetes bacterium Pla133]QDV03598.1 hypothetical protein Pla86_43890 [Planctomycetes bacterium Pla86]
MESSREPVCFTCKQPLGDPPILNEIEGGQACPACAMRVLESLPPVLPRSGAPIGERDWAPAVAREDESSFELSGSSFDPNDFPPEPA